MLLDGGVEDQQFRKKSGGEWNACERDHPDQHGKSEKGRTFSQAIEVFQLFSGVIGNNNQHGKAEERHQEISDEVKRHGRSGKGGYADEQITCVSDTRISEKPFEVRLR